VTGSKVLTDPVELGPELVELFRERLLLFLGHRGIVATEGLDMELRACGDGSDITARPGRARIFERAVHSGGCVIPDPGEMRRV
jgi:hypothetical protein